MSDEPVLSKAPLPVPGGCSRWALAMLAALLPLPATALTPALPEDAISLQQIDPFTSHRLPTGPWSGGTLPTVTAEGSLRQTVWRFESGDGTLATLAPLRRALEEEGYELVFECETEACGGFDFRFAANVLPEPEMHVDLGDFRFLSARRDHGEGVEYTSLMVSRSSAHAFVQMDNIQPVTAPSAIDSRPSTKTPDAAAAPEDLFTDGRPFALDDLRFGTGAADLAPGEYASLTALAEHLRADPQARITLVGHTDAEGGLAANLSLSKRRATAVLERLVSAHGVNRTQLSAEGVAYLSPRASNLTEEGRLLNRRVEAILPDPR